MKTTKSWKVVLNRLEEKVSEVREASVAINGANKQIRQRRPYGIARLASVCFVLVSMYLLIFFVGIIAGVNMTPQKKEIHIKYTSVCTLPATWVDASGYR